MNGPSTPLGVAAPCPLPAPPAAWVPSPARTPALTQAAPPPDAVWTRSAQAAAAALAVLALALIGWHAWACQASNARPALLEQVAESPARPDARPADDRAFRIDVNRADRSQLLQLPNVGPARARRLEDQRRQDFVFRKVEDLRQVSGIGPTLVERLRPFIAVAPPDDGDNPDAPAGGMERPQRPGRPAAAKKAADPAKPLDLNRASAAQLQQVPGIGPTLAERIVAARERRPFQKVEDLRRVSGIGAKTLDRLRPFVRVESAP
jgi:competence protein ComEA